MSSRDEAKKAINIIHRHSDVILDAYFDNHSVIPDTIENEIVIRDLTKYRLAWRIDNFDDVRLSRDIKRLLDGATSSYRRRSSNTRVSDAFEHIKMLLNDLSDVRKRNKNQDRIGLINEIEESVAELIEYMRSAISHFTHYITSGFAFTSDVSMRIAENERVIKMASDLNTIIEELMAENPYTMHGSTHELQKMFVNYLPQAISKCTADLNHTNHQLRTLLNTLKKNQETAKLIEAFDQRYISQPGFMPSIEDVVNIPEVLNVAEPIEISGYADIYDPSQEDLLADLTLGIRTAKDAQQIVELPDIKVVEDELDEYIAEDNPILDAAVAVIDSVIDGSGQVTALESYVDLEMEVWESNPELWILTLVNQINSLETHRKEQIRMTYMEEAMPRFSGFSNLYDVQLTRISHAS